MQHPTRIYTVVVVVVNVVVVVVFAVRHTNRQHNAHSLDVFFLHLNSSFNFRPPTINALDDLDALRTVAMVLGEEMEDAKAETEEVIRQNKTTNMMNNEFKEDLKETRKRAWTAERKQKVAEQKQLLAEARLAKEKCKVRSVQKEKKNKSDLLRYHEAKRKDAKEVAKLNREKAALLAEVDALKERCKTLTGEVGGLKEEFREKEEENEQLKEQLSEEIISCPAGTYTPRFRTLIYKLLNYNVPHEHMSNVISDVLAYADKRASTLPKQRQSGE